MGGVVTIKVSDSILNAILLVITLVWALAFIASIMKSQTMDPQIHAIFTLIVGGAFAAQSLAQKGGSNGGNGTTSSTDSRRPIVRSRERFGDTYHGPNERAGGERGNSRGEDTDTLRSGD